MKLALRRGLVAAAMLFLVPTFGFAQSADGPTPTTKILAVGTVNPGVDPASVRAILPTEVRKTVELYLSGKINQWYSLQGRMGVVFILNVTDVTEAS
jgi:hypothetical protein